MTNKINITEKESVERCPSCSSPLTKQEIDLEFFLCSGCVNRDSDDYQSNHNYHHKDLDDIVFS